MIVEFVGIPGSGKSSLVKQLGYAEARVASRAHVARGLAAFMLYHPMNFIFFSGILIRNAHGLLRYKAGLLARAMASRIEAERHRASPIVVIDEGLVQRLLTMYDRPLTDREVERLVTHIPLPDAVVCARGGDFHRFVHVPNRGNSPRVRQGEKSLETWMRSVRTNVATFEYVLAKYVPLIPYVRGETTTEIVRQELEKRA